MNDGPKTRLCHSTPDDVRLRGKSLTGELIGKVGFTELMFMQILGRTPTPAQVRMLDACLVTLMEHGLTPTAIATRLTYSSAPEAMQGAIAAGLASVGSVFVGTVEGCARLLSRIAGADDPRAEADAIVAEARADRSGPSKGRLPGFGHPLHKPDDPRTPVLLALAEELGVAGSHVAALRALSEAVDADRGRHLTVNATGAIAATLADCGVPPEIMRGFALISRCAGLVAHVREEQLDPAMQTLWLAGEQAIRYEDPEPGAQS